MQTTNCKITELLSQLFAEKSEKEKTLAKLWETDPEKYGADNETISLLRGRSEAWQSASEILKNSIQ